MTNNFIVSSGGLQSFVSVLGEKWEEYNQDSVAKYFDKGMKRFQQRLLALQTLNRAMTLEEEKELRFMLDALLEAKQAIYSK